jgi:hypothetical protein
VDQTAIKKLIAKPEFADKLEVRIIWLDKESAAVLFLSNHMHRRQWNELAKALNDELLECEQYTGGVIPVTDTIVKWCASGRSTCCSDSLCRLHVQSRSEWLYTRVRWRSSVQSVATFVTLQRPRQA